MFSFLILSGSVSHPPEVCWIQGGTRAKYTSVKTKNSVVKKSLKIPLIFLV